MDLKQPKALYLLNFISIWECFSYYGMRVLLVLFMIHELNYSDSQAFALYALYTTLVEFGGLLGGILADRFLGIKRSIVIGGWTIALGHVFLAIGTDQRLFMLGLGLIIVGTNLFRVNVPALLGRFYKQNDTRRAAGFTLFYTGFNIGAFLASILCGIVGEIYGWHAGFGLAAIGMLSGNIALFLFGKILDADGEVEKPQVRTTLFGALGMAFGAPFCAYLLYHAENVLSWFPLIAGICVFYILHLAKDCSAEEKKGLKRLGMYISYLILFFACEEQIGSTLILFSERHINRETWLGVFPVAWLSTLNPLTILATGPLLSKFLRKIPLAESSKIATSFALLGTSFCILYAGCQLTDERETIPLIYAATGMVLIAMGELLIAPTVFAAASELAPAALRGLTMGMVTLGFALASFLSGHLSQLMIITEEFSSRSVYEEGFFMIGSACIITTIIVLLTNRKKEVRLYDSCHI